jgi:hypothetical protein
MVLSSAVSGRRPSSLIVILVCISVELMPCLDALHYHEVCNFANYNAQHGLGDVELGTIVFPRVMNP